MVSRQRLWQRQNRDKKKQYDKGYEAQHKTITFRLHKVNDLDLIEFLSKQPTRKGETKQDFFRRIVKIAQAIELAEDKEDKK